MNITQLEEIRENSPPDGDTSRHVSDVTVMTLEYRNLGVFGIPVVVT